MTGIADGGRHRSLEGNREQSPPEPGLGSRLQPCCCSHRCRSSPPLARLRHDSIFIWSTMHSHYFFYRHIFYINCIVFIQCLLSHDSCTRDISFLRNYGFMVILAGGLMAFSSIFVVANSLLLRLHSPSKSR